MSFTWLIDSKFYPSADPLDTTIGNVVDLDLSQIMPDRKISAIRVRQAMIPNIAFNIVSTNRSFIIILPTETQTITIPMGFYTRDELVAAVNAAFVATLTLPNAAVFTYDTVTMTARLSSTNGGVPQAFTIDIPPLPPGATYRDSPSLIFLMGIDDRVTPISYDPLIGTGPISYPGPVNSDADRFALITCDQARGFRGAVESLSYRTSPLRSPWQDGILAVFPLPLPKGQVTQYFPGDGAQWIHLVHGDANSVIRFRLTRHMYEYFGPPAIYWSMLIELWLG